MGTGESNLNTVYPVVLSGGSGSRLWPLSREHHPKQLLSFLGGKTLLQETLSRLEGISNTGEPVIVCNEEYRFLVADQLKEVGKAKGLIILEPVGRNTAPALTFAALHLRSICPDAVMLVMPADHMIRDLNAFHETLREGVRIAESGGLVTFGVVPTGPETGYGYIKRAASGRIEAFVEKPAPDVALAYVASGEYLWNSGLFAMKASVWLAEMAEFSPDILESCERACACSKVDGMFLRIDAEALKECRSDSIDYAVMERTRNGWVTPLNAGWSDVGAWSSFWEVGPRDVDGNVVQGDVWVKDSRNSLVVSQSRFVAAIGLDEMVVVETADAVLIAPKARAQDVKEVVQALKSSSRYEYRHHRKVHRPWGWYETLEKGPSFQVKRILVTPGASLSLQLHHKRAEHWIVVRGQARVTKGTEEFVLQENESTYIPLGVKHRLENITSSPLEVIEVQSGGYLGEDDIVRFEDVYNRHTGS